MIWRPRRRLSPRILIAGDRVGPYRLLEPLGSGGMATVFVAQRDSAPKLCLLKLLLPGTPLENETGVRFRREAHIASMLDHPHIAPVLDAGYADDQFYIALPWVEGVTLEALMDAARARGGRVPYDLGLPLILQALDAPTRGATSPPSSR